MANIVTYIASDNSAGNAQTLGAADQDVLVKKVIFGTPADGKVTVLYNKTNAYGSASGMGSVDSANRAVVITQPTAAAGKDWVREVDFATGDSEGLRLNGGAVHTDASQVSVIWEVADQGE